MASVAFHLMLAFMIAHELDAVRRHEWRLLPLMRRLPEDWARTLFVWAHVPLALIIFQLVLAGKSATGSILLSAFAIVHVGLHWVFRNDPANEFTGPTSIAFIVLAGVFGAMHLVFLFA